MKFAISRTVNAFLGCFLAFCSASEITNQLRRGHVRRDLAEYDCSVGCPAGNGNPVCAEGITFQHECYAYCQGMTSTQPGACPGDSDIGFSFIRGSTRLLSTGNPGIVTQSQINAYAEDGFLFIGAVEIDQEGHPLSTGPFYDPDLDESGSPIGSDDYFGDKPHSALRITYEGLGYISKMFYPNDLAADSDDKSSTGKNPNNIESDSDDQSSTRKNPDDLESDSDDKSSKGKKGGQSTKKAKKGLGKKGAFKEKTPKLAKGKKTKESNAVEEVTLYGGEFDFDFDFNKESIIGVDTRSEVEDTTEAPYNKICEIDYGGGEGGCSGVVVGKNSIITAAHCVYNRNGGSWYPVSKTAPGRYRDDGETVEPYGTWEAIDATLYGRWANDGAITHDVAVVRFEESERYGPIGDRVGMVELVDNSCNDAINDAHVTGYPADVPNGQQTTSGRCDAWRHSPCEDLRVYHQCDTKGGNSGSPFLDQSGRSFGVHTHGGGSWNSGVMFTPTHLNVLKTWIE